MNLWGWPTFIISDNYILWKYRFELQKKKKIKGYLKANRDERWMKKKQRGDGKE